MDSLIEINTIQFKTTIIQKEPITESIDTEEHLMKHHKSNKRLKMQINIKHKIKLN